MKNGKPKYGNWVSDKRIIQTGIAFGAFSLAALALFLFVPQGTLAIVLEVVLILLAAFLMVADIYFLRAKQLFSYDGGNVQGKILDLLIEHIRWEGNGKALDIGCGSGALAIKLQKKFSGAHITGVDYWGGSWGYYKDQCEENAEQEGVKGIEFKQASASRLPFEEESFDLAVSNLVFHEVKDSADKREVIREALRVVKKGGCFVFQDLLQLTPYFGKPEELVDLIKSWGIREVHYEDTSKAPFIPNALKLPFMVGALGMVYGVK